MNTNDTTRSDSQPKEAYHAHYKVIAPLVMCSGIGDGKTTSCVMAQAATIDALRKGKTLDKPTDQMECACPVLRRLAIRLNDTSWWASDIERTNILRPLIPMLLDSRGDKALTDKRVFFVADKAVRELTPLRLEFIATHSKSDKVKSDIAAGVKELREMSPITDISSALAARAICQKLKASAYASADAYAYASADAYAYAGAAASAYAYASADAGAAASADAYAYAYADAAASADADADAYAYASADASAQKLVYRKALLKVFHDCAAITA